MRADPNSYDNDVVAWANEQARLLRAGCFDALDIEHIADDYVTPEAGPQFEGETKRCRMVGSRMG